MIANMGDVVLPKLDILKVQGHYLQLFSVCSGILKAEFQKCREKGIDTAAALIVKNIMKQLRSNDGMINPNVRGLLQRTEDAIFTLVRDSTVKTTAIQVKTSDVKAMEKRIKGLLAPKELFDKGFMSKLKSESKQIVKLTNENKEASNSLLERNKICRDLKDTIYYQYRYLAEMNGKVDSTDTESVELLEQEIKENELRLQTTYDLFKTTLVEAVERRKEIKNLEHKMWEDIKHSLSSQIVNGLNDLRATLQECLPKMSSKRLLDQLHDIKVTEITDSIMETVSDRLSLADLTPPTTEVDTDDESDSSDVEDSVSEVDINNSQSLAKDLSLTCPGNTRTVAETNAYVSLNTDIVFGFGGQNKKGLKIKQKLYHQGTNLCFGWQRKGRWSLAKTWGFFPLDAVNVAQ